MEPKLLQLVQDFNLKNFVFGGMRAGVRVSAMLAVGLIYTASPVSSNHAYAAATYSIAKRFVGLHERKHTRKLAKAVGVNPRRTPWCGAFVGAVLKRAGKPVPNGHLKAAN